MSPNNVEQTNSPEAQDQSKRMLKRISADFKNGDLHMMRNLDESPPIADYVKNLQYRIESSHNLLTELKQRVSNGEYTSDDINTKIDFEKLLDKVTNQVHHRFQQPEEPSRVEYQQKRLEDPERSIIKPATYKAEILLAALNGEQGPKEISPGSVAREYDVSKILSTAEPAELDQVKGELQDMIERVNKAAEQVKTTAQEKALDSGTKEQTLANYRELYDEYKAQRDELLVILKNVNKKRKQ